MESNEMPIIAAIILAGILSGEGINQDERTIKRSIDIAYRLRILLNERALLPAKV